MAQFFPSAWRTAYPSGNSPSIAGEGVAGGGVAGGCSPDEDDYRPPLIPVFSVSHTLEDAGMKYKKLCIKVEQPNYPKKIGISFMGDVSGSMKAEAKLDNILHVLKLFVHLSNEHIYMLFGFFDDTVTFIGNKKNFIQMTDENKKFILLEIDKIKTGGSTNLCDALESILTPLETGIIRSFDAVTKQGIVEASEIDFSVVAVLLTDGVPNIRDYVVYQRILDQNSKERKSKINSIDIVGVGNSLDSDILKKIIERTGGIFLYISNSGMIGEVFTNYIANLFNKLLLNAVLRFELAPGQVIEETEFVKKDSSNVYTINIGSVLNGQEQSFLLKSTGEITVEYGVLDFLDMTNIRHTLRYSESVGSVESTLPIEIITTNVLSERIKYDIYVFLLKIYRNPLHMRSPELQRKIIEDLNEIYSKYAPYYSTNPEVQKYMHDLYHTDASKGQIRKAIEDFSWGWYYLWSLYYCYKYKITINKKDEAPMYFSGSKAEILLGDYSRMFESIPYTGARTASVQESTYVTPTGYTARVISSRSSDCFRGDSPVELNTGKFCNIDQLKAGMLLKSGVVVKYIIKCMCTHSLWQYGSIVGTGNHPIKIDGIWIPLKDCMSAIEIDCHEGGEYVYGLCIENQVKSFEINELDVATFGHGCNDESESEHGVLSSTFWGTTLVSIIEKINPENGILEISETDYFIRNEKNGWCVGMYYQGFSYTQ